MNQTRLSKTENDDNQAFQRVVELLKNKKEAYQDLVNLLSKSSFIFDTMIKRNPKVSDPESEKGGENKVQHIVDYFDNHTGTSILNVYLSNEAYEKYSPFFNKEKFSSTVGSIDLIYNSFYTDDPEILNTYIVFHTEKDKNAFKLDINVIEHAYLMSLNSKVEVIKNTEKEYKDLAFQLYGVKQVSFAIIRNELAKTLIAFIPVDKNDINLVKDQLNEDTSIAEKLCTLSGTEEIDINFNEDGIEVFADRWKVKPSIFKKNKYKFF